MDAATTRFHDAGLQQAGARKAAILAASLDPAAADALLERLSPPQADCVRQAMIELGEIGAVEQQRVIEEFRRIRPMVPDACPSGIELNRLSSSQLGALADQTLADRSLVSIGTEPAGDSADAGTSPFGFLQEADDESIVQLLGSERASTIAMVLFHLPPERTGELLASLDPGLQAEVLRRFADLENTDPETVREVEGALEVRLAKQFAAEQRRVAGPEAARRILAFCDPETRGHILENLAVNHEELAEELGRGPAIEFDELGDLNDVALRAVLQTVEPDMLSAALLGAPPEVADRFLECVTPRKAKKVKNKLIHPDPIRLSDVEEARRQIAAAAQRLSCGDADRSAAA
jgi:flagellar motor switch protein FliG